MEKTSIKEGQTYHIDTDRVSQHEGTRVVDDVTIEEAPKKDDKKVLVHSPYLQASVLVHKSELKNIMEKGGKAGKKKLENMISEIESDGEVIEEYPVDDGYISNAGDAVEYRYEGKHYEIITWNDRAEEHEDGEKTIRITIGNDDGMAKGGSIDLLNKVKSENKISEKEINLIKNRLNSNRADEETKELVQWIWENTPELTSEQNKKGLDFFLEHEADYIIL